MTHWWNQTPVAKLLEESILTGGLDLVKKKGFVVLTDVFKLILYSRCVSLSVGQAWFPVGAGMLNKGLTQTVNVKLFDVIVDKAPPV